MHKSLQQPTNIDSFTEFDHRYDSYIEKLKSVGIKFSQKLQCALFKLRNGLKYPGLVTTAYVYPSETLVSMPVQVLLTSQRAERDQELKQVYQQAFYHSGPIWQDRILITYLLYGLEKKKDNIWIQMARNFSKEIDILSFWNEADLSKFKDNSVRHAASLQLQTFNEQWNSFQEIASKYPQLHGQIFTYENYKWIYTHAVSRCFGAFLNTTYFVPFCQFFNHTCTEVSYQCVEQTTEIVNKQEVVSQKQTNHIGESDDQSLSEISGDSQDYIQLGDFNYEEVSTYNINWCSKVSFNLNQKQTKKIEEQFNKIIRYLDANILWKGINLIYIGQITEKANLIKNQYMAERKKYLLAFEELESLYYHISTFKRLVTKLYKEHGAKYKKQTLTSQEVDNIPVNKQLHKSKEPQPIYKYFQMSTHEGFKTLEPLNQIYFEYGRLSNRTLLLRYGFALQNNKYEHVWIRVPMHKYLSQYPDLFKKVQEKGLPIYYNLKLKPYVLNTELLNLYRLQNWKMYGNVKTETRDFQKIFGVTDIKEQVGYIDRVLDIYQENLVKYGQKQDLTNSHLSYHEYFIGVYHNQKINILETQIALLIKLKNFLEQFINPERKYEEVVKEHFGQRKQRKMVRSYLNKLKSTIR